MTTWVINAAVILSAIAGLQDVSGCNIAREKVSPAGANLPFAKLPFQENQPSPGLAVTAKTRTRIYSDAKVGKKIMAQVVQDIVGSGGRVIVPRKSMLFGHVAEAQKQNKKHREARLRLVFDSIVLKGGATIPITGLVESIDIVDSEAVPHETYPDCFQVRAGEPCPAAIGNPVPGFVSMASTIVGDLTDTGVVLRSTRNFYLESDSRVVVMMMPAKGCASNSELGIDQLTFLIPAPFIQICKTLHM
jgi:hypothetical protein